MCIPFLFFHIFPFVCFLFVCFLFFCFSCLFFIFFVSLVLFWFIICYTATRTLSCLQKINQKQLATADTGDKASCPGRTAITNPHVRCTNQFDAMLANDHLNASAADNLDLGSGTVVPVDLGKKQVVSGFI